MKQSIAIAAAAMMAAHMPDGSIRGVSELSPTMSMPYKRRRSWQDPKHTKARKGRKKRIGASHKGSHHWKRYQKRQKKRVAFKRTGRRIDYQWRRFWRICEVLDSMGYAPNYPLMNVELTVPKMEPRMGQKNDMLAAYLGYE